MTFKGYARISTDSQNIKNQFLKLQEYGCEEIFSDTAVSGSNFKRKGLSQLLESLKSGDTLVVVRLDRLGRSLSELIRIIQELKERNINFASLSEGMDTNSAIGNLLFGIFAAIAEFERNLIIERTKLGLERAKREGKKLGRKSKMNCSKIELAIDLRSQGKSIKEVSQALGVCERTLYYHLKEAKL